MKLPSREKDSIKAFSEAASAVRDAIRQFIQRRLRELQIDLTFEMLQVMHVLFEKGELNQQEIADTLRKDKASITNLIDNLSKRGLVVRDIDLDDRRNKIIRLTGEGDRMERQLLEVVKELYDAAGRDLSDDYLQRMTKGLNRIRKNLEDS